MIQLGRPKTRAIDVLMLDMLLMIDRRNLFGENNFLEPVRQTSQSIAYVTSAPVYAKWVWLLGATVITDLWAWDCGWVASRCCADLMWRSRACYPCRSREA